MCVILGSGIYMALSIKLNFSDKILLKLCT